MKIPTIIESYKMDILPKLDKILASKDLRQILQFKDLAQLGDFLANFIYSSAKIGVKGLSGGVHVWDSSLKYAMEGANLRQFLGKRTKPDKVADAGEAFIAYAYFTGLLSIPDMIKLIADNLKDSWMKKREEEKEACADAFTVLLKKIHTLSVKNDRFSSQWQL